MEKWRKLERTPVLLVGNSHLTTLSTRAKGGLGFEKKEGSYSVYKQKVSPRASESIRSRWKELPAFQGGKHEEPIAQFPVMTLI